MSQSEQSGWVVPLRPECLSLPERYLVDFLFRTGMVHHRFEFENFIQKSIPSLIKAGWIDASLDIDALRLSSAGRAALAAIGGAR